MNDPDPILEPETDPDPDRREPSEEYDWDGPGDFRERALDSGYDPSDPKAISLEMDGLL